MIKATFYTDPFYGNNRQFDLSDPVANRDNCLYPAWCLKEEFRRHGIDLSTQDIHPPHKSAFVIYNEMPPSFRDEGAQRRYLIILECEAIRPANWIMARHRHFEKIFTWHDRFVDNQKYFKVNFTVKMPDPRDIPTDEKNKFCAMIVTQKYAPHPQELYTERVKAVRWFEGNHPDEFDLYGMGWDRYVFKGFMKKFNKLTPLTKLLKPRFPSYRGTVSHKKDVLKQYRFAICYENARGFPGYITEKIFDCFAAGCVPVYWGPPNVTDHIPPGTFIDRQRFEDYEGLYAYLKNMPPEEYEGYQKNIRGALESQVFAPFSAEYFASTIVDEVLKTEGR